MTACKRPSADLQQKVVQMWDLEMIRQYISWVQKFRSVMTAEAEGILMRYYQMQRQSSSRDAARTTVRMFESLIRIAQVILPHPRYKLHSLHCANCSAGVVYRMSERLPE